MPVTIVNANFESGATGWTLESPWTITNVGDSFDGVWSAQFNTGFNGGARFRAATAIPCGPGQSITASCMVQQGASSSGAAGASCVLFWYDSAGVFISENGGNFVNSGSNGEWKVASVTATAPANTASVRVGAYGGRFGGNDPFWVDTFTWNLEYSRTVTLTSPTEGAEFNVGEVIPFACTIGGTSPPIASVTYKRGATTIGTSSVAPYSLNSTAVPAGAHAITAVATGTDSSTFTSPVVNITVSAVALPTREFKASNAYTYLVAENFSGLTANMPATALVTGVELITDYTIRALIRSKDIDVASPALANSLVAFDITDGGMLEAILMSKEGASYEALGTAITKNITLNRSDFSIVEEGTSEGKKWSVMDSTATSVTIGSSTTLFGVTAIAATDFASRSVGIRFYPVLGTKPSYADSGDCCFRFLMNKLRLRVYFDAGSAEYYFASADKTKIIKGTLVSSSITDGDFETGDASGILQLEDTLVIVAGTQTWIGDDWTIHAANPPTDANQIGTVAARELNDGIGMSYNGLPTQAAVRENRSRYLFITANFFGDRELNSIYGVNGVSRGFAYNGDFFYKIQTTPDADKDKPRHVAYHHEHLALGFDEGRTDISVVGEPWNFDGALGASSWTIGDKVVGLLPLSGTILGIFGSKSIWGISGTTVDNFATQVISPNIGAVEYTITDMGFPVYANSYGVYTLAQTQTYGDYLGSPMSQDISPWLRPRLIRKITSNKEVVVAWPVRSKNQYRLAFSDGYVMSMTVNNGQQAAPTFSFQKYFLTTDDAISEFGSNFYSYPSIVPAAVSSELDDSGEERIHIADYADPEFPVLTLAGDLPNNTVGASP